MCPLPIIHSEMYLSICMSINLPFYLLINTIILHEHIHHLFATGFIISIIYSFHVSGSERIHLLIRRFHFLTWSCKVCFKWLFYLFNMQTSREFNYDKCNKVFLSSTSLLFPYMERQTVLWSTMASLLYGEKTP